MENIEIWEPVKSFEGLYEVSSFGRVKSLSKLKYKSESAKPYLTKEIILKPRKTRLGYLMVVLFLNGERKDYLIHRLVANAFVLNPYEKEFVNHLNEIKGDNKAKNLSWVTHSENLRYSNSVEVFQHDLSHNFIKRWSNVTDVKQAGFSPSGVVNNCKGRQKYHKGLVWSYTKRSCSPSRN